MTSVLAVVRRIVVELVMPENHFDPVGGPSPFCAPDYSDISALDTMKAIYHTLLQTKYGCCFNYASATAWEMLQNGIPCVIVLSKENDGIRVSIGYANEEKEFIICNPVQYVDGENSNLEECLAIPVDEFVDKNGKIILLDPVKMGNGYISELTTSWKARKSNTTISEFLSGIKEG